MPRHTTATFSEAELEVLAQRARGLTNRQAAEVLRISLTTVRTHINRMCRRHHTHRVSALVHTACRLGMLQHRWTPGKSLRREITPRQQDILEGLAEGLSYEEIGARIYVTPNTVSTTIKRLYFNLGAANADHAVAIGWQRGFLGGSTPARQPQPEPKPRMDALDLLLAGV